MAKKKLTKADLKRMEDLSAKNAQDKKANETEKHKLNKLKKELESEKRKLATQWKELKNQSKQAQIEKKFKAGVASKNAKKSARSGGGGGNMKKLQAELLDMKTKYNHEGKRARQFKQQIDQLTAENKVLQRKLKNLQGRKEKGEDPRIKNLRRENKMLKKQIKLLMIELNKKRRWFQRCIKSFKSSRQKWIKTQEDTLKKKGFLIKYVFLDDVKQIKAYKDKSAKGGKSGKGKRFKNKVKVKSRDGGVVVLKDVEIVVLDSDDSDNEGNKKGKKSKGDQLDEMEAYLEQLEAELEADQKAMGGDDYKDVDSDDEFDIDGDVGDLDGDYTMDQLAANVQNDEEDEEEEEEEEDGGDNNDNDTDAERKDTKGAGKTPKSGKKSSRKGDLLGLPPQHSIDGSDNAALAAHVVYLMKELDDRTDDVEKMKEIVSDSETYPDPVSEVANYLADIKERGNGIVDKLEEELHADKGDIKQMQANNDRWLLWLNNLSATMANNGALFNELLGVFEYYLKELKGRIGDLNVVNTVIYVNKENESEEESKEETNELEGEAFEGLKKGISERHEEAEGEFESIEKKKENEEEEEEEEDYGEENKEKEVLSANAEKVKEIRDGLVSNNADWRALMETVANDYDLSKKEKSKLVENINDTNQELKALLDLVQKIPKRQILQNDEAVEEEEEEKEEEEEDNENENDD